MMMTENPKIQSPEYAKMSQATAISVGLAKGRMYRGAVNRCVNLLVHYPEGCSANCAYCGLATKRPGRYTDKSFIHVDWPIFSMDEIVSAINAAPPYVTRTCISMITNGKCRKATLEMTGRLTKETALPVSLLISPTILNREDLEAMKECGADKIGIALDLAPGRYPCMEGPRDYPGPEGYPPGYLVRHIQAYGWQWGLWFDLPHPGHLQFATGVAGC